MRRPGRERTDCLADPYSGGVVGKIEVEHDPEWWRRRESRASRAGLRIADEHSSSAREPAASWKKVWGFS